MKNLEQFRLEIIEINQTFLSIIQDRKLIVSKVQELKGNAKSLWDKDREVQIFTEYVKNFPNNSNSDDYLFSLLMETQAAEFGDYPKWSLGTHLDGTPDSYLEMTNPVLVYIKNKQNYLKLNLNNEFRNLLWQK